MAKEVYIKRVYEPALPEDGYRILIDRLWPRGMTREKANIEIWLKDISPSDQLRKWFGHDPAKWTEFQKRYKAEIARNKETSEILRKTIREQEKVTLVYSAKDELHNDAVVLKSVFSK